MVIHPRENDLVLGTHGRGFWVLDDITILEEMTAEVASSESHLAGPRTARQLSFFNRGRSSLGHSRFASRNPPNGAHHQLLDWPRRVGDRERGGRGRWRSKSSTNAGVLRRLEPPDGGPDRASIGWSGTCDIRPRLMPNLDGGIGRGPWAVGASR